MYQNEMFGKQANSLDEKAVFMIEILIMNRPFKDALEIATPSTSSSFSDMGSC